jgi:hypothetical protein
MDKLEILKKLGLRKDNISAQIDMLENQGAAKTNDFQHGVYHQLVFEYNFIDILLLDDATSDCS